MLFSSHVTHTTIFGPELDIRKPAAWSFLFVVAQETSHDHRFSLILPAPTEVKLGPRVHAYFRNVICFVRKWHESFLTHAML